MSLTITILTLQTLKIFSSHLWKRWSSNVALRGWILFGLSIIPGRLIVMEEQIRKERMNDEWSVAKTCDNIVTGIWMLNCEHEIEEY